MAKVNERHKIVRQLLKIMTKEELAFNLRVSVDSVVRWSKAERTPNYATFYLLKQIIKREGK